MCSSDLVVCFELTVDPKQTTAQKIGRWRLVGLAAITSALAVGRAVRAVRRRRRPPTAPMASG